MSIFRRDPSPEQPSTPSPAPRPASPAPPPAPERRNRPQTLVAAGSKISGEVRGDSDVVVEGELQGRVEVDSSVLVNQGGRIQGDVVARAIRIGGHVIGNVRGSEKVEIMASGRLEGDVVAPQVVLVEGAFFKGKVEMTGGRGIETIAQKRRAEG